jgi:hypothetical protein
VLKNETIAEFKICNGVMLLLHHITGDHQIPMTLVNIHTGKELVKFEFDRVHAEIEFLEQFNEKIMLK